MLYRNSGKIFNVDSVELEGMIINVNGTSITNNNLQTLAVLKQDSYSVFCEGDEIYFDTFLAAYIFATQCQKDTIRLEGK